MRLAAVILALAGLGACAAEAVFPVPVHAGRLMSVERTLEPLPFLDLREALLANRTEPAADAAGAKIVQQPPPPGKCHVVFWVEVGKGRTLSVLDYELEADGERSRCLGLSLEAVGAFDARLLHVSGPVRVRMLFACAEGARQSRLVPLEGAPLAKVPEIRLQKDVEL